MRRRWSELGAPLSHRDFRQLWVAQLLSELGDWAARLALAVLVFDRTGSAVLTGLVTTISLLPWIGIGQVMATRADRRPRRQVMVVADLVRAAIFAVMVLPIPVWALLVLGFLAALMTPPFEAARSALLPDSVPEEQYGNAIALTTLTFQLALVVGYAAGGGLVVAVGARGALAVNAATFVLSALVLRGLRIGVRAVSQSTAPVRVADGVRVVWNDHFVRRAVAFYSAVAACAMVGESLVAVYTVDVLGASDGATGLLAASIPVGTILATAVVPFRGDHRHLLRISALVAVAGSLIAFAGFAVEPSLPVAVIPFIGLGVIFGASVPAHTVAGLRLPVRERASAFSTLQGTLMGAQATGAAAGSVLAGATSVTTACLTALVVSGAVGVAAAARPPQGEPFTVELAATDMAPTRPGPTPPAPPPGATPTAGRPVRSGRSA